MTQYGKFFGYVLVSVLAAAPLTAQTAQTAGPSISAADPMLASMRSGSKHLRLIFTEGADKMTDSDYAYRPTSEVRTFAQLMGHVADSNYQFCSSAMGEKIPVVDIEKTTTKRSDLQRVLAESFDYCDKAFAAMGDPGQASALRDFRGGRRPALVVLNFRAYHGMLHWGNAITYMRLRGKVPPSAG